MDWLDGGTGRHEFLHYGLLYLSTAVRLTSDKALSDLLIQSREKNAALGITGLLIYHKDEFMQLLEGDKQQVLRLYETIREDHRHHTVMIYWQNDIED